LSPPCVPITLHDPSPPHRRAAPKQHHESRKRQLQKRDKTLAANEAAFKAAEKKAAAQLANLRNNASTAQVRRAGLWVESPRVFPV
jgi:hypothetical protein